MGSCADEFAKTMSLDEIMKLAVKAGFVCYGTPENELHSWHCYTRDMQKFVKLILETKDTK